MATGWDGDRASVAGWLCEPRNVENDDFCDVDVELESCWAGEGLGNAGIPRLSWDHVDLFRDHMRRRSAVHSDGHGRRRCSNGDGRCNLREGPGIDAGMGDFALT